MTDNAAKPATGDPMADMTVMMQKMQEAVFKPVPGYSTTWFETLSEMSGEILSFTTERIKQDVQTQRDLLGAKTISDIQRIQKEYFETAFKDYASETAKMIELGKHLTPAMGLSKHTPV